jgi:hypothetical protein
VAAVAMPMALIASTSPASVPGGSSIVVAAGPSRSTDQLAVSWCDVYQWSPTLAASAVPTPDCARVVSSSR